MRPTIAIGDVHGLTYWKKIVKKHPKHQIVFLGDYLDPYDELSYKHLIKNLSEIIALKKARPTDVVLLLGNHDLHYFSSKIEQSWRYDYDLSPQAEKIFLTNRELFQFAYQEENCVFTHAGVTQKWFMEIFKGDATRNIADQLNAPKSEQESTLYTCGESRGGFDEVGGIFWAGIEELFEPLVGYTQVVGHNRVQEVKEHTNKGGRIIFCDCLFNKGYLNIE
ncbi:metallophosphoesterase [Odoribacter sp. OttesenSCG-928-G04]|nr:metallophosphoesterase [Odoribacter sp. OttesenSCG-928-G04]MDL2331218.1 metallophosphoesterase [Odoribacter sp. OttesenSCG-928-A06]